MEKMRRKEACEGSQGRKIRKKRNARKDKLKKFDFWRRAFESDGCS